MAATRSLTRGQTWMGQENPSPEKALKPQRCRCENPAVLTEEDKDSVVDCRCIYCGKRPR